MALITCRDASFAYNGRLAVSGLNFDVNSGDYIVVVGENGSGKSTLLKGLLRLKQPVDGRVVNGDGLKADEIGYLPQQTVVQKDFPAGVFEIVLSGRLNRRGVSPFYSKVDKAAAEEQLQRFGIQNIRNKCYRELSGGQQQRVLLARALCASRKLLILDEPASGLDPRATQDMYHLIAELNHETGIAVVMVSHDIRSAVKYAGQILHLNHTQIFFGTTEDYVNSAFSSGFVGGGTGA